MYITEINEPQKLSSECSQYKLMKMVTNIQINAINLLQNSNKKTMDDREHAYKMQGVKFRFMAYVLVKWISHGC